jgi:hypothetical protein
MAARLIRIKLLGGAGWRGALGGSQGLGAHRIEQ